MHCVDLGESFRTYIFLQNLASIQPRTSPLKFAVRQLRGRRTRRQSEKRSAASRPTGNWKSGSTGSSSTPSSTTRRAAMLGLTQLSNYLTLKGSFSAVSKPNFASKYSLESSRRDLQNALLCTVLVGSVWVKKYTKIKLK